MFIGWWLSLGLINRHIPLAFGGVLGRGLVGQGTVRSFGIVLLLPERAQGLGLSGALEFFEELEGDIPILFGTKLAKVSQFVVIYWNSTVYVDIADPVNVGFIVDMCLDFDAVLDPAKLQ